MKLQSDFWDFYDYAFSQTGKIFNRKTTEGPSKPEQFKILQELGFKVPQYGTLEEILEAWGITLFCRRLVIYDDVNAHCGEGKRLVKTHEIKFDADGFLEEDKSKFCCEYIPGCFNLSWRLLQIGKYKFWLEYESKDDWRSNCGNVTIKLIGQEEGKILYNRPLLAIDFVIGDEMYAVDLNISPGVKGTGIEKLITATEIVKEIESFYE